MEQRTKFTSTQSWFDFLNSGVQLTPANLIAFRLECYAEIEAIRGRPLLIYVSQALGALPGAPVSIDLTDIDGFTDLVNSVPADKTAVDVLIKVQVVVPMPQKELFQSFVIVLPKFIF